MKGEDGLVYWELVKKNFQLQLQYRLAHFINNVGSCLFGFVYVALWTGILAGKESASSFRIQEMVFYIAFNQCLLWLSCFLTPGLGISEGVKSGTISIEMARPTSFYLSRISQELGRIAYNFFVRSLIIGLVMASVVGFHIPRDFAHWVMALLSIGLGILLGLNMMYLIGITACWTYEIRWIYATYVTLLFALGGQMVPVDFLPHWISAFAQYLPFASTLYYPAMIYLGKHEVDPLFALSVQTVWVILTVALSVSLTKLARRKLEIQGG